MDVLWFAHIRQPMRIEKEVHLNVDFTASLKLTLFQTDSQRNLAAQ
jgi:hypothetical protein